jgi:hypothetical protein
MDEKQQVAEALAVSVASKTTYAGGIGSILAWAASIDWLAVLGVLVALAGFLLNGYFQFKRNKREELESSLRMIREQEKHNIEMQKLKGECNVKQD